MLGSLNAAPIDCVYVAADIEAVYTSAVTRMNTLAALDPVLITVAPLFPEDATDAIKTAVVDKFNAFVVVINAVATIEGAYTAEKAATFITTLAAG
jgi:hypothetical protein